MLREFQKYWHCNSQLVLHPSHVTYHTLPSEVAHPTHELVAEYLLDIKAEVHHGKFNNLRQVVIDRGNMEFSTIWSRPLLHTLMQAREYYKIAYKKGS